MENKTEESDVSTSDNETEAAPSKPRSKSNHPTFEVMIKAAVKELNERNGSSLHAIKKYIAANYVLDINKSQPYIKNYVKKAIINGDLISTKGNGISGSFKLPKEKSQKAAKPDVAPKLSAALKIPKKGSIVKENSKKQTKNNKTATAKKTETMKPKVIKESKIAKTSREPKTKNSGTKTAKDSKTKSTTGVKLKNAEKPKTKINKETKEKNKKLPVTFKVNKTLETIRKSLGVVKKASKKRI